MFGVVLFDIVLFGIVLFEVVLFAIVLFGVVLFGVVLFGVDLFGDMLVDANCVFFLIFFSRLIFPPTTNSTPTRTTNRKFLNNTNGLLAGSYWTCMGTL